MRDEDAAVRVDQGHGNDEDERHRRASLALLSLKTDVAEVKAEVSELRADMAAMRSELKGEIADLRTELKGEISDLRIELKGETADLRTEVRTGFAAVRQEMGEMKADMFRFLYLQAVGVIGLSTGLTVALIKLLP